MAFDTIDDPRGWIAAILPTLERSPLYTCLAAGMAHDPEIAALLRLMDQDQPTLILLFTVVNALVLKEPHQPLARFYPYLHRNPAPPQDAYPAFRAFCQTHGKTLRQLLPRVRLQTNEVTRCACLLPAFHLVAERGGGKPLALIELGSSAGLNLNWFRYGYSYQPTRFVGSPEAPVQIHCALPEHALPAFGIPEVASCQGIDLAPLDINRGEDVHWLKAHIWPEEVWRYRLLDAAITFNRLHPVRVVTGDAVHVLPALLSSLSLEQTLCVYHSFALNQGPPEVRQQIEQQLAHASRTRLLFQVALEVEPTASELPKLELFTYQGGSCISRERLACCALHGEQMTWLLPA